MRRQRSPVRTAAARSLRAAFFAPLMRTVPWRGRPPSTRKTSRATGSGRYSQWNGRASAMPSLRPSGARRAGAAPPGGDARRRGSGPGPAWRAARAWARSAGSTKPGLEGALGVRRASLGPLEVDVRREVGRLRHHHDLVRPHLDEAADDDEGLLPAVLAVRAARPPRASRGAGRGAAGRPARPRSRAGRPRRRRRCRPASPG